MVVWSGLVERRLGWHIGVAGPPDPLSAGARGSAGSVAAMLLRRQLFDFRWTDLDGIDVVWCDNRTTHDVVAGTASIPKAGSITQAEAGLTAAT